MRVPYLNVGVKMDLQAMQRAGICSVNVYFNHSVDAICFFPTADTERKTNHLLMVFVFCASAATRLRLVGRISRSAVKVSASTF